MKLLKSMTTSYELSLRLKELGVEQTGGEYYWVLTDECEAYCYHHSDSMCNTSNGYTILCRAFTLGELVREIKGVYLFDAEATHEGKWFAFVETDQNTMDSGHFDTPEEAAGELLAEIKSQEKQKA